MQKQAQIYTDADEIRNYLKSVQRVAVLGIRSDIRADSPTHFVAASLAERGLEIVPVPVYEPTITQILGQTVYRQLTDIPGAVDLVDVFRRPEDIDAHLDDLIAIKPKMVWFQTGITNDRAAATLVAAGIDVVQDRCLMIDYSIMQEAGRPDAG